MSYFLPILFTIFIICAQANENGGCSAVKTNSYDVCVLGGGASGMAAAVLAKDKGLSVLVIEKAPEVGGQCNTKFATVPQDCKWPENLGVKCPDWTESGVQQYPNTSHANLKFFKNATFRGGWAFDTAEFMGRFCKLRPHLQSMVGSERNFFFHDETGTYSGPVPATPTAQEDEMAFGEAITRFFQIFDAHPWLDNGVVDGPIPEEFLGNFFEFIVKNNFANQLLIDRLFNPYLYFGGMGSWDKLETIYALRNLAPTIAGAKQDLEGNFVVEGGCMELFRGITKFLGNQNVWTDTTINKVYRPAAGESGEIKLRGVRISRRVEATCKKLVVAFAQTPGNIDFLEPDTTEETFFQNVNVRYYGAGRVAIQGPLAFTTGNNYTLAFFNTANPPVGHIKAGFTALQTFVPYGPTSVYAFSDTPITKDEITEIIIQQLNDLATIPNQIYGGVPLITSFSITDGFDLHEYYPYPSVSDLADPVGFYSKFEKLQGRRNTYWVGVLQSGMGATHNVMELAKRVVDAHF